MSKKGIMPKSTKRAVLGRAILLFIAVFMLSFSFAFAQGMPFAGGDGSEGNPYQISNCTQLDSMRDYLDAYYDLIQDIDCSDTVNWDGGAGFMPIGTNVISFTGSLDGNNFNITGLAINRSGTDYIGLFGYTSPGVLITNNIKNIGLADVNILGFDFVGGLIGYSYSSTISSSYATGTVSGRNNVGSLIGGTYDSTISDSYSEGNISGNGNIGGIVGYAHDSTTISNCYSTGAVSGATAYSGGVVGYISSSTISNSYSMGTVSGANYVGGLVGYAESSTISNCYSTGAVSGSSDFGGLVGYESGASCSGSFWDNESSNQTSDNCMDSAGKTTAEMKTISTFTDAAWDFTSVWSIDSGVNDGYPFLIKPYYCDNDIDGYISSAQSGACNLFGCDLPAGCSLTQGNDCNDADMAVNPGAAETCDNGIDDNCDGSVDEGCLPPCTDSDFDGYYAEGGDCGLQDCNDADPTVNPGATESCNEIDDNCDGSVDEVWICFSVGDGSAENPYQISDCMGLNSIKYNLAAYYIIINDMDCLSNGEGVGLGADGITLDCDGNSIVGPYESGSGVYSYGGNYSNLTIKNCNIYDFARGIELYSSSGHNIINNTIYENAEGGFIGSGIYLEGVENSTISNNSIYGNDVGLHLYGSSLNTLESNTIYNNNYDNGGNYGYGIYLDNIPDEVFDPGSNNNIIIGNTIYSHLDSGAGIYISDSCEGNSVLYNNLSDNDYGIWVAGNNSILKDNNISSSNIAGIAGSGTGTMLNISQRNVIRSSNLTINGNISFGAAGVLELIDSYLTLNNILISVEGNITTLSQKTADVAANVSQNFDFSDSGANITLNLGDNVSTVLTVSSVEPASSPSGFTAVTGIDIAADDLTKGSLSWAMIYIYYNQSQLDSLGISESALKIYYYNLTSAAWQLEPDQGINTTDDYVWVNVTHFSIFGIFGSTPASSQTYSKKGGAYKGPETAPVPINPYESSDMSVILTEPGGDFDISQGNAISFSYGAYSHKISMMSVGDDFVIVEVKSSPQIVSIKIGETKQVDIDGDLQNDISITLKSIASGLPRLMIKLLKPAPAIEAPQQMPVPGQQYFVEKPAAVKEQEMLIENMLIKPKLLIIVSLSIIICVLLVAERKRILHSFEYEFLMAKHSLMHNIGKTHEKIIKMFSKK